MITRTDVNENVYTLSNKDGVIAYGNKKGISYMRSLEEKEIKEYAKKNGIKTHRLSVAEFFVVGCMIK